MAGDRLDLGIHHHKERVDGMASRGKQAAAALGLGRIPAKLPVPRPYSMIVVDLGIMQPAQQPPVDDSSRSLQLAGVTQLEAHACLHPCRPHRSLHTESIRRGERDRLFDDQVLSGRRRGDDMAGVLLRIAADRYHMQPRIGQHSGEVCMAGDRAAVTPTHLSGILGPGGPDGRDPPLAGRVYRRDVGSAHPPIADDAYVVFIHWIGAGRRYHRFNSAQSMNLDSCSRRSFLTTTTAAAAVAAILPLRSRAADQPAASSAAPAGPLHWPIGCHSRPFKPYHLDTDALLDAVKAAGYRWPT